ncbi:YlaF family protein [Robertmurraya massiliosenegalensis]|uniref:YlaF family protein n=1 Tax=Robertmurraya TaxID=2837507 RepID=UPI0039A731CF
MSKIKWPFLFLAIVAVACMSGVGIAISYRSIIGTVLSLLAFVVVMGFGFVLKRKIL